MAVTESGRSPLHLAAQVDKSYMTTDHKSPTIIAALVAAGADPKVRDNKGVTPLHEAAKANEKRDFVLGLR